MNGTRVPLVWTAVGVLLAVSSAASAHGAGSGTLTAQGAFVLTPPGTLNNTFHAYLSSLGLPIGPGDTLSFLWTSDGGVGPVLHFEIHSHALPSGYVIFYSMNTSFASDSWSVPGSDAYMVYWVNPNNESANVTYTFNLIAPPANPLTALIWIVPLVAVSVWVLPKILREVTKRPRSRGKPREGEDKGADDARDREG